MNKNNKTPKQPHDPKPVDFFAFLAMLDRAAAHQRLSIIEDRLGQVESDLEASEMSLRQMRITREMDTEVIQKQAKRLKSETDMNIELMDRLVVLSAQAYCLLYRGKMPTEAHIIEFMERCEATWPVNDWLESLLGPEFKNNKIKK